jgi:hypothetical protein
LPEDFLQTIKKDSTVSPASLIEQEEAKNSKKSKDKAPKIDADISYEEWKPPTGMKRLN